MNKRLRKLNLSRETIHELEGKELPVAQGGGILPISLHNTCRCPTVSCKAGFC